MKAQFLPVHRLKVKWLVHVFENLTRWEKNFINRLMRYKGQITEKQISKLDEIYETVRFNSPYRSRHYEAPFEARYLMGHAAVHFDDVHDFDR